MNQYKRGDLVLVRNSGEAAPQQGVVVAVLGDTYKVMIADGTTFECPASMLSPRE